MEKAKQQAKDLIKEGKLTKENALIALKYLQACRSRGLNYSLMQVLVSKDLLIKDGGVNELELEVIENKENKLLNSKLENDNTTISKTSAEKEIKINSSEEVRDEIAIETKKNQAQTRKEFIKIKKSLLWSIACGLFVVSILIFFIIKRSSEKNYQSKLIVQKNTPELPIAKNTISESYDNRIVMLKYIEGDKELLNGTGFLVKSGNKTFILTRLEASLPYSFHFAPLTQQGNALNNSKEIYGVAFPGTKSEKKIRIKFPINRTSNNLLFLEPLDDISFLDSFSYNINNKVVLKEKVTLLGYKANPNIKDGNLDRAPQIQVVEANILQNYIIVNGKNYPSIVLGRPDNTNCVPMKNYIAFNSNNEILGISSYSYFSPNSYGNTMSILTDPNVTYPIIQNNVATSSPINKSNTKASIKDIRIKETSQRNLGLINVKVNVEFLESPEKDDVINLICKGVHFKDQSESVTLTLKENIASGFIQFSTNYLKDIGRSQDPIYFTYDLILSLEIIRRDNSKYLLEMPVKTFYLCEKDEAEVQFEEIVLPHPVTCTAMTEDGENIIFANESTSKISIWNINSNTLEKTISFPNPIFILSRGDNLFVVNKEKGIISALSKKRNWEVDREFEIPRKYAEYLSAPNGKSFKGEIYVTGGPIAAGDRGKQMYLLNIQNNTWKKTNDDHMLSAYTFSYNGKNVFKQKIEIESYLYQVRNDSFWYSDYEVYWGMPPKIINSEKRCVNIPDRNIERIYSFNDGELNILNANSTFSIIKKTAYNFKGIRDPFGKHETAGYACFSYAFTKNGKVFVYYYNQNSRKVFFAKFNSPEVNDKNITAIPKNIDKDFAFKRLPISGQPSCMTLTEDGKFLLIGDDISDQVIVWDIVSQAIVITLEIKTPIYILSRNNKAYIINQEKGDITIISNSPNWHIEKTIKTGDDSIYYISAPRGTFFQDKLMATAQKKIYLIDTLNDSTKTISLTLQAVAHVSFDGRDVIEQVQSPGGYDDRLISFSYNEYVKNLSDIDRMKAIGESEREFSSQIQQLNEGGFWIGNQAVFSGRPLKILSRKANKNLFIADYKREVYYELKFDANKLAYEGIDMIHLNQELKKIRSFSINLKPNDYSNQFLSKEPHMPIAVTLENDIYLFLINTNQSYIEYAVYKNGL